MDRFSKRGRAVTIWAPSVPGVYLSGTGALQAEPRTRGRGRQRARVDPAAADADSADPRSGSAALATMASPALPVIAPPSGVLLKMAQRLVVVDDGSRLAWLRES